MASFLLLCLLVVPLICILYLATMRPEIFFLPLLLPSAAQGVNVVLSNDDGWAEINIRSFYNALTAVGNSVVLSAPADNKSGTGIYSQDLCSRTTLR